MEKPSLALDIREFLVEIFGILVPGSVFTLLASVTFVSSFILLSYLAKKVHPEIKVLLDQYINLLRSLKLEIIIAYLALSYVIGHFFFRRGPEKPDRKSFEKIRPIIDKDIKENRWVAKEVDEVHFPYPRLKRYLEARGWKYLAQLVPYDDQPSKTFANKLKIRLLMEIPEKCGLIIKNEAHIRLMSSMWYAGGALEIVALIALILDVLMCSVFLYRNWTVFGITLTFPFLWCFLVFLLGYWTRNMVENFLHYQRIREIFFLLETAYYASKKNPQILKES